MLPQQIYTIKWQWVKGHNKNQGNEEADKAAKKGAQGLITASSRLAPNHPQRYAFRLLDAPQPSPTIHTQEQIDADQSEFLTAINLALTVFSKSKPIPQIPMD